mmetsp:Transcript_20575/g.51822  ORF Transcript_20575/g.51822 Transcript_20575/m.51822 type:complete len:274 (+) Transcript_20575:416-1237(+)
MMSCELASLRCALMYSALSAILPDSGSSSPPKMTSHISRAVPTGPPGTSILASAVAASSAERLRMYSRSAGTSMSSSSSSSSPSPLPSLPLPLLPLTDRSFIFLAASLAAFLAAFSALRASLSAFFFAAISSSRLPTVTIDAVAPVSCACTRAATAAALVSVIHSVSSSSSSSSSSSTSFPLPFAFRSSSILFSSSGASALPLPLESAMMLTAEASSDDGLATAPRVGSAAAVPPSAALPVELVPGSHSAQWSAASLARPPCRSRTLPPRRAR